MLCTHNPCTVISLITVSQRSHAERKAPDRSALPTETAHWLVTGTLSLDLALMRTLTITLKRTLMQELNLTSSLTAATQTQTVTLRPNPTLTVTLRMTGTAEEGGESAAGRPARGWGDISFVLPLILTGAGGLFGIAAGMTVLFSLYSDRPSLRGTDVTTPAIPTLAYAVGRTDFPGHAQQTQPAQRRPVSMKIHGVHAWGRQGCASRLGLIGQNSAFKLCR